MIQPYLSIVEHNYLIHMANILGEKHFSKKDSA